MKRICLEASDVNFSAVEVKQLMLGEPSNKSISHFSYCIIWVELFASYLVYCIMLTDEVCSFLFFFTVLYLITMLVCKGAKRLLLSKTFVSFFHPCTRSSVIRLIINVDNILYSFNSFWRFSLNHFCTLLWSLKLTSKSPSTVCISDTTIKHQTYVFFGPRRDIRVSSALNSLLFDLLRPISLFCLCSGAC